jgi:transposase
MKRTEPQVVDLEAEELQGMLRRAERKQFRDEDYETVQVLARSYAYLTDVLKGKEISVARLRKMLFGAGTEKTDAVVGSTSGCEASPTPEEASRSEPTRESASETPAESDPASGQGHGRNGVDAYEGAEKVEVLHESLEAGDSCPDCGQGTVYDMRRPGVLVRITGQAPVQAKVYRLQKLRCNLCGKVFTAQPPEGVGSQKYDATVGSMIGLLKYGSGMPFNRIGGLQGHLGIPLPASTQWDIVRAQARHLEPVYAELLRQAAGGDVVYNDDTTVRILELMGKRARQRALAEGSVAGGAPTKQRTGLFTSGIISTRPASGCPGRRIALFFSGRKHAGENLKDVLAQRAADLGRGIFPTNVAMCWSRSP